VYSCALTVNISYFGHVRSRSTLDRSEPIQSDPWIIYPRIDPGSIRPGSSPSLLHSVSMLSFASSSGVFTSFPNSQTPYEDLREVRAYHFWLVKPTNSQFHSEVYTELDLLFYTTFDKPRFDLLDCRVRRGKVSMTYVN
jgi:hypothetical protein